MYNLPLQDHAPAAEPSTSDPQLNIQPELTLPPPRQTPPVLDSSHTPMPGIYNFRVRLGHFDSTNPTGKLTGSTTYSSLLDRLFINMGVYTPITLFSHTPPPEGAVVRCFVVFSSQEKCTTTVTRCPNHRSATDHSNTGNDPQKAPLTHILQVSHPQAQYLTTPSGVESAVVPYNARESSVKNSAAKKERTAGFGAFQDTTSIRYMCYSSCAGSINRENIHTVFRLELGSDILGVASLDTKICSCPSRDRTKAEKLTRQQEASGTTGSSRKRSEKGRDSPSHSTDIASTGATKDSHTSERIQAPSIVHPHSSQATLVGKRSQRLIQNVQHKLPTRINTADTHTAHPMRWSTAQSTRIATADSTVGIDEDAVYYVAVRGRQNYEVLSRVADGLNALAQRPPRARSFRQHNPLPTRTPSLLVTSNPPPPPTTTANTAAPTNTNTNTNTNTSTDTKTVFSRPGQNSTIPSLSSRRNPSLVSSTTSVPPAQPRTAASSRSLRTVPSRERRVSGTVPSDVPVSESPARNTR
ncbi:hypothetical protein SARC_04797 [Sphaeroforma arctica JP610]|uniref:p53 DNA-binding domain-containing protein n=1 Tax=Sphaeroforma arctica JP610 TaxID=667725 RepID=A0A0L0G1F4_9EUKA|nr:hypothetical protein SARC_04797 [Sphaeroforma arctica JP610]KNC82930.1 hypothetical protein SARC_04797 [Sphaeroforma arctica JP610]|eukprot:XP_014156832.1 hypothetical protein SARC_04797 [Sphaeroforma arctica JP610]